MSGNTWKRRPFALKLSQLGDTGSGEWMPDPKAKIDRELPPELRDVFFTDGDRALNFIEADTRDKRARVEKAIRSLLGLDIIEASLRHVGRASRDANREAKKIGSGNELETVTSRLDRIAEDSEQLEKELLEAKEQFSVFSGKIVEVRKSIDDALVRGNKQQLQQDRQRVGNQLDQTKEQMTAAASDHAKLFRLLALPRDLLAPILSDSMGKLNELREEGKFPRPPSLFSKNA